MFKHTWLLGAACFVIISLTACGTTKNTPNPENAGPSTAASLAPSSDSKYVKAEELFKKTNCISCHGVDLSGRVGPKTNLQKIGAAYTPEQIANQIRGGGGGMPGYEHKLTADEIQLLTDWLSSKK
ncbi:cytochrome c [Paenibacillus sp. GP183]|jgi:cytochrome c551|uniref:c-type cytochrome n=1 Tax=Paenibacillus sp. GP183 TaxID=1882751 RepID=UPI00089C5504|nr:cytochrome c [Paenibacillus sp. GP183]SEC51105.1 cytochrome c551 [Paenibacillus sp. GP183]